ncbi:serine/threonine protein kinase [Nostoc sp. CENA67]|uniref:non-specific serine/threonine protein kinase n=1 Tax=Amazonocrinis nigriterrae CENA67 TaxID=2794033 RepID=A0A8J7L6R6_9NOST|nr:serine/threonine-protein kinase [Amazonocrinis nigriterrae]MBH8561370.1 serine/threonine protein kinase [Amazonocrinis nigriterrae CENA67]
MNGFPKKITNLREYNLEHNQLAQMCGSKQLFRDRYQILRILGRGGFGITFLARNAVLPGNPLCVIKQLSPKVTNPKTWPSICQRFEKEAKTLAQLGSHSQIPLLLDYFQGNGEFYLVQEYIKGNTLSQEVRQNGPKSEAAVKQFLQELLPILQYIHQNHVIHRDIKPQNLLRCQDDGRLVLIDFGAVKEKLADACENSLSKPTTTNFVGTIGFAPPEQISLRPVYASDIYAVGVTCLYLLTGKAPSEFAHDHYTGEICWHKQVDVSDSFARILAKMLKISLKERFHTVEDVIKALGTPNYSPSLSNCLATQPLTSNSLSKAETPQTYMPPLARTAIAIRARKAKLQDNK